MYHTYRPSKKWHRWKIHCVCPRSGIIASLCAPLHTKRPTKWKIHPFVSLLSEFIFCKCIYYFLYTITHSNHINFFIFDLLSIPCFFVFFSEIFSEIFLDLLVILLYVVYCYGKHFLRLFEGFCYFKITLLWCWKTFLIFIRFIRLYKMLLTIWRYVDKFIVSNFRLNDVWIFN